MDDIENMRIGALSIDGEPQTSDVIGTAKEFIDDLLMSLGNEGMYYHMGVNPDKTFGLFGEKGTGKTMSIHALNNTLNKGILEQAMAGSMGAPDFKLAVFQYDIGSYGTAYINMSSRIIQRFFDYCFQFALKFPTMIVMDEADAVLGSRRNSVQTHQEDRKTLETIMKNLQEAHDTPNVFVALMSNLPEACDDASLRAGRIDKKYVFKLPSKEERVKAFDFAARKINSSAGYQVVRGYDAGELAELSAGFNYADIMSTVDAAVKTRVRELIEDRTNKILVSGYVSQPRIKTAIEQHKEDFVKKRSNKIGF